MISTLPSSLYFGLGATGGHTLQALRGMLRQVYGSEVLYPPLRTHSARHIGVYSPINFLHLGINDPEAGSNTVFEPSDVSADLSDEAVALKLPMDAVAQRAALNTLTQLPEVQPWASIAPGMTHKPRLQERLALFYDMQHTQIILNQIKASLTACIRGTDVTTVRVTFVAALDEPIGNSLLIDSLYLMQIAAHLHTPAIHLEPNVFLIIPSGEVLISPESEALWHLQAALHEIARLTQTCNDDLPYPIHYPGLEGDHVPFIMPPADRFYYFERTSTTVAMLARTLLATLDPAASASLPVHLQTVNNNPDNGFDVTWRVNTLRAEVLALPVQAMADACTQTFLRDLLREVLGDTSDKSSAASKPKLLMFHTPLWEWIASTDQKAARQDFPEFGYVPG